MQRLILSPLWLWQAPGWHIGRVTWAMEWTVISSGKACYSVVRPQTIAPPPRSFGGGVIAKPLP